jgi:tetratricopeptide (TPR) repeat protein
MLTGRVRVMRFFRQEERRWLRLLAFVAVISLGFHGAVAQDLKSLVQTAFDLHQKGKFSEALPLLQRAHAIDPDDYFVNLLLGIDSLRTGQAKNAVPLLKKASRLRPQEEFPLDYLGEAYARLGIYGEAAEAYLNAVRVAPASVDSTIAFVDFALARFASISELLRSSHKGLAAEYRLRAIALPENDASRLSLLQRAADLDPEASGIWSDEANAGLATGDLGGAERFLQRALKADPNDQAAWIADAQLAARKSNWQRAGARLQAVAQQNPILLAQNVERWPSTFQPPAGSGMPALAAKFLQCVRNSSKACNLGTGSKLASSNSALLYREQKWQEMTKLPAPQPDRTEAWFQRGVAFAKLNDCREAIPMLERGVSKSSTEVYGMFLLSWCYSQEAGHTAEKIQQNGGDDAPLHLMRGDILLRLQAKPDLALSEYQRALAKGPNDPAVLERLANAQFGSGKIEAAQQSAKAALKIDPRRLGAKRTVAKIAMQERDYVTALPYLEELTAINPQDLTMRIELAKAFAQTGASDQALRALAPALEQGYPDEKGSLHYLLGTILKKMGRTADADQAFATATQLSEAFQQKSYRDQDPDAQP